MEYIPVIGLEIHAQLRTESKMFCSCVNDPETREPNVHVCPLCLGHPGTLPVTNEEAIKKMIRIGKALNCNIQDVSRFDRKNYFYPDLPKGYQISQDRKPLCYNGYLKIGEREIRINRVHLEEDTGRLVHDEKEGHSLVDFNRAGTPLMELVTEPDIRSAQEAKEFAEELRLILQYLGVSGANLEKGQMRVEVNISLSKKDEKKGTKVEIKNLNSFRSVNNATWYEIERQKKVLEKGEQVVQETRGWDEEKEETFSQRKKEGADDYRYFPEPDLPPLYLNESPFYKDEMKIAEELPQKKRARYKEQYGMEDDRELKMFIEDKDLADYFEKVVSLSFDLLSKKKGEDSLREEGASLVNTVKSYLLTELMGILEGRSVKELHIEPHNFAHFVILIHQKEISSKIAKKVLKEMVTTNKGPSEIIEEKGLSQISDKEELDRVVTDVINENLQAVNDYKEGKEEVLQFLVGQVMKKTKGRAAPEEVNRLFKEKLEKEE